jgi:hypothetical protein
MIVTTPPKVEPVTEPLSKSVSTSLTATDATRLDAAAKDAGVSRAAYLRAAVLAKLDTAGK